MGLRWRSGRVIATDPPFLSVWERNPVKEGLSWFSSVKVQRIAKAGWLDLMPTWTGYGPEIPKNSKSLKLTPSG